MSDSLETDNSSITRPASKVMLGSIFSLLGGLASNIIIASIFGARADMDAYITALVIPNYIQLIFYSSLSFVLVPAFIETQTKKEEENAWALVGTFFWLTLAVLLTISVIGSIFSEAIIRVSAPGFQNEKAELASHMLAVLMLAIPFMGLGTLTVGIQNARRYFFWPSVAPAFGAFGNMITLLILYPVIGSLALSWGFLIAIMIQAGFTTLPVILHGWRHVFSLSDQRMVDVIKLMGPMILIGMVASFNPVAERYFSSGLPDGQIAYIGYVGKLSGIFVALLASGIAASIYPAMARAYNQGGVEALAEKSIFGLRLSFAISLPSIAIVSAVSIPFISLIFERGAFEHSDSIGISLIILPCFLDDVFFRMISNIFQRSFYVLKVPASQLLVSTTFLVVYILIAGFFVKQWGYVGLVWAGAVRRALSSIVIWALLSRKFPAEQQQKTLPYLLKYCFAALAAYIGGNLIATSLASVSSIVQVAVGGSVGLIIYLGILRSLDHEILKWILDLAGTRSVMAHVQNRCHILPFKR